ncbi:MAG TPA: response regulator [Vicinamibacterales bacterium]|nr:response regulator [Vicinamibacterales bacterium]
MTESLFESFRRAVRERGAHAGPQKALVVDDEDAVRNFVVRVLQEGGYAISTADDGPTAIEVAGREGPFDVLVTDLMMPQMNGDELARTLRQSQPGLKVLYLTGFSDKLFREKVTLWEDEAFLDKPCSVRGLLEAVSLLINGRLEKPPAVF